MKKWSINWSPSSVENPSSNGHAEAAVKAMKQLVLKTGGNINSEQFRIAMLEWRNTPNATGKSPAQLMFGRPLRTQLPSHMSFLGEGDQEVRQAKRKIKWKAKRHHDRRTRALHPLQAGLKVLVQDQVTNKWDKRAVVISERNDRSYVVKFENGTLSTRNRRLMRPDPTARVLVNPKKKREPPEPLKPALRRSDRLKRKKQNERVRFHILIMKNKIFYDLVEVVYIEVACLL